MKKCGMIMIDALTLLTNGHDRDRRGTVDVYRKSRDPSPFATNWSRHDCFLTMDSLSTGRRGFQACECWRHNIFRLFGSQAISLPAIPSDVMNPPSQKRALLIICHLFV